MGIISFLEGLDVVTYKTSADISTSVCNACEATTILYGSYRCFKEDGYKDYLGFGKFK